MYTGTIFNWHDNSGFNVEAAAVDTTNRPLFMVVNSFDKGPEKLMEVDATMFNSLYGNMSYEKHGQASIQAQGIINAGGRLLVKRVCAADSELANSVLVATIEDGTVSWKIESITTDHPKKYSDVRKAALNLYEANTTYPLFIITDIGRGVSSKAVRIIPDYDTSRGLEKMIYRYNIYEGTTLIENANISFDPSYTFNGEYYGLDKNRMVQVTSEVIPEIFEQYVEDVTKLVYPQDENETEDEYAKRIVEMKKLVSAYDLINAYTFKGENIYERDINGDIVYNDDEPVIAFKIKVDDQTGEIDSADLNTPYGNKFGYVGSYGSYGETPAKFANEHDVSVFFNGVAVQTIFDNIPDISGTPDFEAYKKLVIDIASVYLGYDTDGSAIDEVWDTDSHKIFAICDANYNKIIKDCITNFVEFRKDCIFLRDCNIGAKGVKEAQNVYSKYILGTEFIRTFNQYAVNFNGSPDYKIMSISNLRSKFVADYGTNYEIVDPISKKNIEVTMLLDLAIKLTTLYIDQGPFSPLAGTYNGFKLDNAIEGTINFIPIITPTLNQKQVIDDLKLNYAIFEDEGTCVVQSNYTSQDANSQLSFINNVLAIQEVARVVRTVCPRNRFRLITGSDMSEYATAVSRVLQGYTSYFDVLEFTYTQDPLRSIQKIFYASINFSFNNWAQTEIFDLYALSNTTTSSVNS
jgi:hypothetical protein